MTEILVALFTGAWIETLAQEMDKQVRYAVALFTGAWIETLDTTTNVQCDNGRALHGRVD